MGILTSYKTKADNYEEKLEEEKKREQISYQISGTKEINELSKIFEILEIDCVDQSSFPDIQESRIIEINRLSK